jgi:hypothetical protein
MAENVPYKGVAAHAHKWQQIGVSPALLRNIKYGVRLPLTGQPRLGARREYPLTVDDYAFADAEINRWISHGFAEEITKQNIRFTSG